MINKTENQENLIEPEIEVEKAQVIPKSQIERKTRIFKNKNRNYKFFQKME